MSTFNPESVCAALKAQTKVIRKPSYKRSTSRLDRHANELIQLRDQGNSIAELQRWLRFEKRVKVAHSTVSRWLSANA
ncbi:hypothetical protein F9L16_04455 [Agarivorans sp. B2Z047]|nr:hypothetical protein [Agarivorans sp. B2Z047]